MFKESEIIEIKKGIKLTGVAEKHKVTQKYVSQILHGQRAVKSKKAQQIASTLRKALEVSKQES